MTLFDTHCHFDVAEFDGDREAVIARTLAAGVDTVLVPGYVASLWPRLFQVCRTYSSLRLLPAPGLHPCYVDEHQESDLNLLEEQLQTQPDIVAVGEIGLDYFLPQLKEEESKARQLFYFQEQLRLASFYNKPVILHIRKAHHDIIRVLNELKFKQGGIAHAFSGGIEEAKRLVSMGFKLGVGGPLTYTQSKRLREVVSAMPLDAIVLETDAPDMIPQAHRQEGTRPGRNSPEYLPSVAVALAALKKIPLAEVIAVTRTQGFAVLGLSDGLKTDCSKDKK